MTRSFIKCFALKITLTLLMLLTNRHSNAQTIITIAGSDTICGYAGDGGPAVVARLCQPAGIAFDKSGNIIIPDIGNARVRKLDMSGIITTIAGTGTGGSSGDGGQATGAQLTSPVVVDFDMAGNMYIAESYGNKVRKVDPTGIITTFAGDGTLGYSGDGGPATAASFDNAEYVKVNSSGEVYITDIGNNVVRKVTTSGIISTVIGNGTATYGGDGGPATAAGIKPADILFDTKGNIVVCDWYNNRIRNVDPLGIITTIAGNGISGYSGDGGPATAASINGPCTIYFDPSGNLLIADMNNHVIRKIDATGIITTIAGTGTRGFSGDGGAATNAQLYLPAGLLTDATGNIYIADMGNNRIRKILAPPPPNSISGNILFKGAPYYGDVKVWLIKYDPGTKILSAVDSSIVHVTDTIAYYQFSGVATDSFRIKAANDTSTTVFGYQPTYHGNSFYWSSAAVVYHTSGFSDINKDIVMNYGAVTSGPGFISGNVTSGANKGSGDSDPVIGLRVFALSTSGIPVQSAMTDILGNYSFSNLLLGSYVIFPEELGYDTKASASITLTTDQPTVADVRFIKHTLSKEITPVSLSISGTSKVASLQVFPNPSKGELTVETLLPAKEEFSINVFNLTGQLVYSTVVTCKGGVDSINIDLSELNPGQYILNAKSSLLNRNMRIVKER